MVAGFLFVSFDNLSRSAAPLRPYCAVGLNLSDHLVIRGRFGCSVTKIVQSGSSAAVKPRIYPQCYAQLCINRVDGCLSAPHHCVKTDLGRGLRVFLSSENTPFTLAAKPVELA